MKCHAIVTQVTTEESHAKHSVYEYQSHSQQVRHECALYRVSCFVVDYLRLFATIRYCSWLFAVLGDYSGFITSPSKIGVAKNMRGVLRKWKPHGIFQI